MKKKIEEEDQKIDINEVIKEYSVNDDVFNEEKDITKKVKKYIFSNLDEVDRRIILLYAELQSLRKLGSILGVSASSAYIKIKAIKEQIKNGII